MQRVVRLCDGFESWRDVARETLVSGHTPESIDFQDSSAFDSDSFDFPQVEVPLIAAAHVGLSPRVPKAFLTLSQIVAVHRAPDRWNALYRVLFRLQAEPNLLHVEVDTDVAYLLRMRAQVQRDLHKMHAFLRFRKVQDSPEVYAAWYQPDHYILRMAVPFFVERFSVHGWSILTPYESASWNPQTKEVAYGVGASQQEAPPEDAAEDLWRSYYSSIFNPARMNPEQMRQEMPVRYWKNLPETAIIPALMQKATHRVEVMMEVQKAKPSAAPFVPEKHTLTAIRQALPECRGCPLYQFATQVVPGRGAIHAALMLVGEQPGDQEDLRGEPFVGPAGGVLRNVLNELRIDPKQVFMTNAVKHFKFKEVGKRRLHENPRMSEITACKPWLAAEIDAVRPQVVLCLGASAAKSLLGGTFALMKQRGSLQHTPDGMKVFATVHPSAVLRARDEATRKQLLHYLKTDMERAFLEAQAAS